MPQVFVFVQNIQIQQIKLGFNLFLFFLSIFTRYFFYIKLSYKICSILVYTLLSFYFPISQVHFYEKVLDQCKNNYEHFSIPAVQMTRYVKIYIKMSHFLSSQDRYFQSYSKYLFSTNSGLGLLKTRTGSREHVVLYELYMPSSIMYWCCTAVKRMNNTFKYMFNNFNICNTLCCYFFTQKH